jgi:triphosphoribosyl-dephospho-CoA synthase CitG
MIDIFQTKIDNQSWKISQAFLNGVLMEVTSYPKPGLVSSISMGSHKDMNILTFMASSAAIYPCFTLCAQAGRNHEGELRELLKNIRQIGIVYEKELLKATKGINTQRGILFANGVLSGAAGYLSKELETIGSKKLFDTASIITQGIVERELGNLSSVEKELTAGERLYIKYKATGIRGEVEKGFPSVRKKGLPAFKEALKRETSLNHSLVHTLISLMTVVEDTTILWRKNKACLKEVQLLAQNIIDRGSVFTDEGLKEIQNLNDEFIKKNISPGGSADLVAVTAGSYLLENGQFPVSIL